MKYTLLILTAILLLALQIQLPGQAHQSAYLYGTVYTTDGEKVSGFIRWGKEEMYWTDRLNATKRENPYLRYLGREEMRLLQGTPSGGLSGFLSERLGSTQPFIHAFACQFGDVAGIKAAGGRSIEVLMRNGENLLFHSGSNDLGASLQVYALSKQEKTIPWSAVDQVNFHQNPDGLEDPYKGILWGDVYTSQGVFTGQVQWDRDERCGADVLDGSLEGNKLSIPFSDINSIAREGRGSLVVLRDGSELFLTGSNDVNPANRGILVTIPGSGRISIPWEEFRKVHFNMGSAENPSIEDFPNPEKLKGRVESMEGDISAGFLVFDLDEAYDYEMLNGKDGFAEWEIPFRNIRSISPKNDRYSSVVLKSGKTLLLGEMQDVSAKNNGMLIFGPDGGTTYLPYNKVRSIIFE